MALVLIFSFLPKTASRFTDKFIASATNVEQSAWWYTINGGWVIGKDNWLIGIGVNNYRAISTDYLSGVPFATGNNHPHNYYLQMLAEAGLPGVILGVFMLASITTTCFIASLKNRQNVVCATAWVIPFALFWPLSTTGDFFGQWNNIFMWSAVALALSAKNFDKSLEPKQ